MPLLFIGTGIIFILTGLKGDASKLWGLVQGDFTGHNNFVYWLLSISLLGALGYIPHFEKLSRLFVVLVLVGLLVHNHGFFAQFQAFINGTGPSPTADTLATNLAQGLQPGGQNLTK